MKKKEQIIMGIALITLILVLMGISYAAFTYIGQGQRENTINTGNLTFIYDESNKEGNGISIQNATPTSDELGSVFKNAGSVFEFSVIASTKGSPIYYEIYVTRQSNSTLPERIVKTYLTELQGEEEIGILDTINHKEINLFKELGISQILDVEDGRTLYQERIEAGQDKYSKTFRYRMWISDTATEIDENGVWKYNDQSFTVRINIYASNEPIQEPLQPNPDPNPPVLVQGYIPVVYNKEKSSWVKANINTEWYNYENQEWANAVTVKQTGTKTREEYMNAEAGTEISIDDINTMWVWIPRYSYTIKSEDGKSYYGRSIPEVGGTSPATKKEPGAIDIKFAKKETKETGNAQYVGDNPKNYRTHPAFTFGDTELDGLWFGKFELATTSSGCNNCNRNNATACETRCSTYMSNLEIKPNVKSWRYAKIVYYFNSIRNMQSQYADTYGFSTVDSNIHMIKNSEWAAVAYLSQSEYGKYGNPDYIGVDKEIYQNKSSDYITGNSNGMPSSSTTNTQVTYDIEGSGTGASTTGNITGVYDMVETETNVYVMGNLNNEVCNTGFGKLPEEKYYDLYTNPSIKYACNKGVCFGHALSETGDWYQDGAVDSYSDRSWIIRNARYSNFAEIGIFAANWSDGGGGNIGSTRAVQSPLN